MKLELRKTRNKNNASYKTIYISDELIEKLSKIANDNSTSFNNVVISIIEMFLKEMDN